MAGANVREFNDDNFDEQVLNADKPVLVDFWAEWCMPCKMIAPTIDELANDYEGRAVIGKVDTEASRDTAARFGINAIPTIILFKNGEQVRKFVGWTSKKDFQEALDNLL